MPEKSCRSEDTGDGSYVLPGQRAGAAWARVTEEPD